MIKNKNTVMKVRFLFVLMLISPAVFSATTDEMVIGRYLSASKEKLNTLTSPLNEIIAVKIPLEISTIGDAMEHLLQGSGYQLAKEVKQVLYQQAYPRVYRNIDGVELRIILKQLAGEPYQLVVDPVNRLISFRLQGIYHAWH